MLCFLTLDVQLVYMYILTASEFCFSEFAIRKSFRIFSDSPEQVHGLMLETKR